MNSTPSASHIRLLPAVLYGAASLAAQTAGLRLYFVLCHANEFYLSLYLFFWLAAAASGVLLAASRPPRRALPIAAAFGLWALPLQALVAWLFGRFAVAGAVPPVTSAVALAAALAAPPALASGVLFPYLLRFASAASVYAAEVAGFTFAALVDLALMPFAGPFNLCAVFGGALFVSLLSDRFSSGVRGRSAWAFLFGCLVALPFFPTLVRGVHPVRVAGLRHTAAGVAARAREGAALFINGVPVETDERRSRVFVDLAVRLAPRRGAVLLVEPEPSLSEKRLRQAGFSVTAVSSEPGLADEMPESVAGGTLFGVLDGGGRWDLALMAVSVPASAAGARFLNRETLARLKKACRGLVVALPFPEGRRGAAYTALAAFVTAAFRETFGEVCALPSEAQGMLFVSSLPLGAPRALSEKVFLDRLEAAEAPDASRAALAAARLGMAHHAERTEQRALGSYFLRARGTWVVIVVALLAIAAALAGRRAAYPFGTGGCAMGVQTAAAVLLQLSVGVLYGMVTLLIACFMACSWLGAVMVGRRGRSGGRATVCRLAAPATVVLGAALLCGAARSGAAAAATLAFVCASFAGLGAGAGYASAARVMQPARAYAADLAGALLGAALGLLALPFGFDVMALSAAALGAGAFVAALRLTGKAAAGDAS